MFNYVRRKASDAVVKCFSIYFDEKIAISRAPNISIVLCNELMRDIHNSMAVLLSSHTHVAHVTYMQCELVDRFLLFFSQNNNSLGLFRSHALSEPISFSPYFWMFVSRFCLSLSSTAIKIEAKSLSSFAEKVKFSDIMLSGEKFK